MFKKLLKFLRFLLIGAVWSVGFGYVVRMLVVKLWKFDVFYKKQWEVIAQFWENNGVIVGASDYMLFVVLLLSLGVWIWGWRRLVKVDYISIILWPLKYISDKQVEKYQNSGKRVVFKNMGIAEKKTIEDVIEERIKQESGEKSVKESEQLRKNISEKIIRRKDA